ncbi:MAG TPA: YkgJ family cysteine cluster protein [Pyrinomonadaceae bacterium]|jgi:Fe-S-cluster containining protein
MQALKELKIKTDCAKCIHKCCSEPYDWVYMTKKEISRISIISGLPKDKFVVKRRNAHTGYVFNTLNLPCRFLDSKSGNCTIYESRPLVCRLFPFYPEPLTGQVTFLPAQCGSNLYFVSPEDMGWSLSEFEQETYQWLTDLWNEAIVDY